MVREEEYIELKKRYNDGYHWIARDENGYLYTYYREPKKRLFSWKDGNLGEFGCFALRTNMYAFPYIKWEDEKPTKILDLIQGYEKHEELKGEVVIPQFVADWIEECKKSKLFFSNLNLLEEKAEVKNWIYEHDNGDDFTMKREEMVIKAYYDGYVVEKEKLYTVRLVNGSCLYKFEITGIDWIKAYSHCEKDMHCQLTQSEIESVDPILMQIAKPVVE